MHSNRKHTTAMVSVGSNNLGEDGEINSSSCVSMNLHKLYSKILIWMVLICSSLKKNNKSINTAVEDGGWVGKPNVYI